MPFIVSRVNIKTTLDQKLQIKQGFGKFIELIPGKTEERIILALEDEIFLAQAGDSNEPIAMIEIGVLNNRSHNGYTEFSKAITDLYQEVLGIPAANVTLKFSDVPAISRNGIFQEETK